MTNDLNVQQGAIYQVPLEKDYGFAYVKQILAQEFSSNPYIIFKVFDKHTLQPEQIDVSSFSSIPELTYRLLSLQVPQIRGKNKWTYLGIARLSEDESILPDFKADFSSKLWNTKAWETINWSVVHNLDPTDREEYFEFGAVQKLGLWQHNSLAAIKTKLTMFWIKKKGESIENYYSEEDLHNNFAITPSYFETENLVFPE